MSNVAKVSIHQNDLERFALETIFSAKPSSKFNLFSAALISSRQHLEAKLRAARDTQFIRFAMVANTRALYTIEDLPAFDILGGGEIYFLYDMHIGQSRLELQKVLADAIAFGDGKIVLQNYDDPRNLITFGHCKHEPSIAAAVDQSTLSSEETHSSGQPAKGNVPASAIFFIIGGLAAYAVQHPPAPAESLGSQDFGSAFFTSLVMLVIHPFIHPVTGWGVLALALIGRICRHFGYYGACSLSVLGGGIVASLALTGDLHLGVFVGSAVGIFFIEFVLLIAVLVVLTKGPSQYTKDAQRAELERRLREIDKQ